MDCFDCSMSDTEVEPTPPSELEYWVDYSLNHHGILYAWRNNLKQVLLAIEDSIAQSDEFDDYDIVLLSPAGEFITSLESVDSEEEALKTALLYQQEYPKGNFPELEDYRDGGDSSGERSGSSEEDDSWISDMLDKFFD